MLHLIYVGESDKKYAVDFKSVSDHVVQITGDFPVKRNGFLLSRIDYDDKWDYTEFRTLYRNVEGGAQFSDDGSVYTAPIPTVDFFAGFGGDLEGEKTQNANRYEDVSIPNPVPEENYRFAGWVPAIPESGEIFENVTFQANFTYVETLEEIMEAKVTEMNEVQQQIITAGIDVTLTDGTTDHFDLTDRDQMRLMGLQEEVKSGAERISWHTSDEDEHCKFYSNADMAVIAEKAMAYVKWHVTYFRDLRIYIRSLATKDEVAAVTYGMDIPEKYQSDPLKAMIAAQSTEQEA